MADGKTIRVWTAQADVVLDTIEKTGIYHVKRRYIIQKYGSIAPLFLTAYDWFVGQYAGRIQRPREPDYAIWVYLGPRGIANYGPGDNILELTGSPELTLT